MKWTGESASHQMRRRGGYRVTLATREERVRWARVRKRRETRMRKRRRGEKRMKGARATQMRKGARHWVSRRSGQRGS